MFKDFINWIQQKISLDREDRVIPFREREVWRCSVGVNLGCESNGKNQGLIGQF